MAAPALLAGALKFGPSITGAISGLIPNKDDADRRLPANARAYAAAQSGSADAIMYLRARSGRFGSAQITGSYADGETPGTVGPWATAAARDDAFHKYQSAVSGVPLPPDPPAEANAFRQILDGAIANVRREVAGEIATVGGALVTGVAQKVAPEGSPEAGTLVIPTSKNQLLLIAAAVIVAILLLRR